MMGLSLGKGHSSKSHFTKILSHSSVTHTQTTKNQYVSTGYRLLCIALIFFLWQL